MDLGLTGNTEKLNYISFKPSINAWFSNMETDDAGEMVEIEMGDKPLLLDISSLKTGWIKIEKGMAPDCVWDEKRGDRKDSDKPSDNHKRGFSINAMHKISHGWLQWQTNAVGSNMGLQDLLSSVSKEHGENTFAKNSDKVMKVKYTGSKINNEGVATTRIPHFEFVSWVDDPTQDDKSLADEKDQAKDVNELSSKTDDEPEFI